MARPKTLNKPQNVKRIAKIYFMHMCQGVLQKDIADSLGIPPSSISTYLNKHVKRIMADRTTQEYVIFYNFVVDMCNKENYAHDLLPPEEKAIVPVTAAIEETKTIMVEEEMKVNKNDLLLLVTRRKQMVEEIQNLTEEISRQIDVILDDLLREAERYASAINEMVDNLTVKQYRDKQFPECFTRKIEVLLERVKKLETTSEAIEKSFLTTDSAVQKYNDALEYIFQTRLKLEDLEIKDVEKEPINNTQQ